VTVRKLLTTLAGAALLGTAAAGLALSSGTPSLAATRSHATARTRGAAHAAVRDRGAPRSLLARRDRTEARTRALLRAAKGPCSLAGTCTRGCAVMVSSAPPPPTELCSTQSSTACTEDVAAAPTPPASSHAAPRALPGKGGCSASSGAGSTLRERLGRALPRFPHDLRRHAERLLRRIPPAPGRR